MGKTTEVRSVCGLCSSSCGVILTLQEGRPVAIRGNPESPTNRGDLCVIGQAALEHLEAPGRLKYPLHRVGERGAGRWERISWDQAFTLTAEAFLKAKAAQGPESVMLCHGSSKPFIYTHLVRLANAFGTPNVCTADNVCHVPHMLAAEFTFGYWPCPEFDHPPGCVVVWGANKAETGFSRQSGILRAVAKGAKLVVIDPYCTPNAEAADLWLQLRPGTDAALALGLIGVIIEENRFDQAFVEKWTVGFDQLKAHVRQYSPERVAAITWVPAEKIVAAARMYATHAPGHIEWGNGLDESLNSFQASRAIAFLMALSGSLEVPGGEVRVHGTGMRYGDTESSGNKIRGRWSHELELRDLLSKEERRQKVSPGLLPDFRYVTNQDAVTAMLEGKPYRIRVAFIQGCNPLNSWSNIKRAAAGFRKLDFLAVSDFFLSPTAHLADIVFPAATFLEFDGINLPFFGDLAQIQRRVVQVGESRSGHEIINGLAWKLGLGRYFWKDMNHFWDYVLEPTGIPFSEMMKRDRYQGGLKIEYRTYEKNGFYTDSGKVEFRSRYLEENGFPSLPDYREAPETPSGRLESGEEFPLTATNRKIRYYRHSTGRQIPSLRENRPQPLVEIHPETAAPLGIKEGDWVSIDSKRGRIRQKAVLSARIDPRVVYVDYGWWYPEKAAVDENSWLESNLNALTPDDGHGSTEVGSFQARGFAVRIHRADAR